MTRLKRAGTWCAVGLLASGGAAASAAVNGPTFLWGKQNTDMGTLALDASNVIYTGQGNNQGTGSLSRYSPTGSLLQRKNYNNPPEIPRVGTASGPGGAIYSINNYTVPHINRYDAFGTVAWTRTGSNYSLTSMAANTSGVLAAGAAVGSVGGPSAGAGDAYAIKYDPNGSVAWQVQFGGNDDDLIWDVAMDQAGNSYFGGYTWGAITSPPLNTPHVGGTPSDAFVMSYSSTGAFRWGKQLGTTTGDSIYAVATDPAGNVIVVGDTHAALTGSHLGGSDILVRKYDTNGNTLWSKQLGSSSDDRARAVTTDPEGNIYIGAYTGGSLGAPNVPDSTGGATYDALVGMLEPDGDIRWWFQTGTPEFDMVEHIAFGSNGNVYVAGDSSGTIFAGGTAGEEFIMALQVPEPASAAVVFLPLVLLRRRRIR